MSALGIKSRKRIGIVVLVIFAAILSIICILPMYALILASFSDGTEILRSGLSYETLVLREINFSNYRQMFDSTDMRFWGWFQSSVIITGIQVVVSTLISSIVGYAFAVYHFKGKNFLFILVLIVMMLPMQILLLPIYGIITKLGLMNSYLGVILPNIVSPLAIFFFRQYASGALPTALLDSGRIDGCNEYSMYFRLMLPLMLPAFGTIIILLALNSWNDFVWPLIVITDSDKTTLPVGIKSLLTPYGNNYNYIFPSSVLSFLPIIILFVIFQKYFMNGLAVGSVKE